MNVWYSEKYVAAGTGFDTTRKSAQVAQSLLDNPLSGVKLAEPIPLTAQELSLVHTPEYVNAVKHGEPLAYSSGFAWDPGVWEAVTASNGGVVSALMQVWKNGGVSGSLSSGLHHARAGRGGAFCTFNGLAVAADMLRRHAKAKTLIIDLDAHQGGGTYSIVHGWEEVYHLDIAVCPGLDAYSPMRTGRATHDVVRDARDYIPTLEDRLDWASKLVKEGEVDLVLYNAGVDLHEACGGPGALQCRGGLA